MNTPLKNEAHVASSIAVRDLPKTPLWGVANWAKDPPIDIIISILA